MAQIIFKGDYSQIVIGASETRAKIEKIFAKPVSLNINTQALSAMDEATLKTLRSVTQYVNAVARATAAETRAAAEARKAAAAAEKKAKATQRETQVLRQLATVQQQVAQAETALSQSIVVGNNALVSRIALMQQTVALYNQMQTQFGGQRLLEGNSIFGGGMSGGYQGKPGSAIDVDWTPVGEAGAEAFERASDSARQYSKTLKLTGERQSWFTGLMDDTFGRVVAKMALWQIMGNAISAMTNSLKDAVSTIKEVDSELANIEKVSGMSESELRKLEESAYDVASAYGVAVQDYLSAVATFSKAGYDDLAPMLGELAVKTQLVGDVNAEMASKMLLAVDAAYEMKGSQEQLTNVLDKMNYVENNYSTSIEKLTEGMPIVASTASQANMSIEELIATLGTITAVTQESGTKAATAWRSLILNLFGEIGAEIEEGEKVTEESVASLNDLMWKYARSAMEAAKATGTIVDPMEAIAALSQSMKEGILTEAELFSMLSGIGGKLRTNQLVALVENFDMVQEMLAGMGEAAGSADKELSIMLDTWNAKTEQLKNNWTKFVAKIVDTEQVKDGLDLLIELIGSLDTEATAAAVQLGLMAATIAALSGTTAVQWFKALFTTIATGSAAASSGLAMLTSTMLASPLFWGVAVTVGIYAIVKAIDKYSVSISELNDKISDSNKKLDDNKSRLKEINNIPWNERTTDILAERDALERENAELQNQIENYKELKKQKAQDQLDNASRVTTTYSQQRVKGKLVSTPSTTITTDGDYYRLLTDELQNYTSELQKNKKISDESIKGFERSRSEAIRLAAAIDIIGYDKATDEQKAMYKALLNMEKAYDGAVGYINNYVDGLLKQAAEEKNATKSLYDLSAEMVATNNQNLNFSQQIAALRTLATQADYAASAIAAVFGMDENSMSNQIRAAANGLMMAGKAKTSQDAMRMAKQNYMNALWGSLTNFYTPESSGSPSGGRPSGGRPSSGSAKSQTDKQLAAHKENVSLLKSELTLMEKQGKSVGEQVEKIKAIQNALHRQAEYMRSIGASQDEINALSAEWYDWQEKIAELQKSLLSELDSAVQKKLDEAKANRDAELDAIQAQIDALKEKNEAEDTALAIEKKRAAITERQNELLEKQKALLEARNERTVRTYNAKTNQWEWIADEKNVKNAEDALKSAQDALEKAKDDLADYNKKLDRDAEIAALEAKKKQINAHYDALENAWNRIMDSLNDPVREINDILKDIAENATPALREQILKNRDLFEALGIDLSMFGDRVEQTANRLVKVLANGSAPGGLGVGDRVVTGGGTYEITGVRPDGSYESKLVDKNQTTGNYNGEYNYGTPNPSRRIAKVRSNGSAPPGLNVGDWVVTAAGTYQITAVNPDGSYQSALIDQSMTTESYTGRYDVYDQGGWLNGTGGIKATSRPETVLPPSLTEKLLSPAADATFQKRMSELGFLYGATDRTPVTAGGTVTNSNVTNTSYTVNGVRISAQDARSLSFEEVLLRMTQLGGSLGNYNNM